MPNKNSKHIQEHEVDRYEGQPRGLHSRTRDGVRRCCADEDSGLLGLGPPSRHAFVKFMGACNYLVSAGDGIHSFENGYTDSDLPVSHS